MASTADIATDPPTVAAEDMIGEPSTLAKRQTFWRSGAPRGVAKDEDWHTWNAYLSNREARSSVGTILKCKSSPLLWGLSEPALEPETLDLVGLCHRHSRKPPRSLIADDSGLVETLADWRAEIDEGGRSLQLAIESLAVAGSMPWLAGKIASQFWWELLDGLWHLVGSVESSEATLEATPADALTQQMLAAELPLTLALAFPEMRPMHQLRPRAVAALSQGLDELLNGDGLPHGAHIGFLLPLLATWTRSRAISLALAKTKWKNTLLNQYELAVRQAIRWTAADGSTHIADEEAGGWDGEFLQTVITQGGDPSDAAGAAALLPKKLLRGVEVADDYGPPDESDRCEWSGLAVMRTDWSRRAPSLAIDFSTQAMRVDVRANGERLLGGVIKTEIEIDGKAALPEGSWDEVCWLSDDEVDYLELTLMLDSGAKLDRQVMLAREDMVLYFCDSLLGNESARLAHRLRVPLAAGVHTTPAEETREVVLHGDKSAARVFPLALPEWRQEKRIGELTTGSGAIELTHSAEAVRMNCPLLVDLSARRALKQCTWRQLTIAEKLEIQPPEVAVGYRAQAGKDQWLFYRSLAQRANRTVLGQNTSSETFIARFLPETGEADELVEVEG